MKKKAAAAMIVLAMAGTAGTPATVSALSKKEQAMNAYKNFLNRHTGKSAIVDLDKNGVPELVYSEPMLYGAVYTYNVKKGKRVCLKKVRYGKDGYIGYHKKKKMFVLCNSDTGGGRYVFFKVKKGKAIQKKKYIWVNGKHEPQKATINGKTYSRDSFFSRLNKEEKGYVRLPQY